MLTLFCGYDPRESIGFHVFVHSLIRNATAPVSVVPLSAMGLHEGTNTFTASRFLIPKLMGHKGRAIFMDASDMLLCGDIRALDSAFDPRYAVQVVQHPKYSSRHKIKYRDTQMECPNTDYERKNWASVMLINCEHPDWKKVNPESDRMIDLLQFKFTESVGSLPPEWNRLVDEGQPDGYCLHWTAGVPGFPAYANSPFADRWHAARKEMEEV